MPLKIVKRATSQTKQERNSQSILRLQQITNLKGPKSTILQGISTHNSKSLGSKKRPNSKVSFAPYQRESNLSEDSVSIDTVETNKRVT